jgi:uncharacterized membrane protein
MHSYKWHGVAVAESPRGLFPGERRLLGFTNPVPVGFVNHGGRLLTNVRVKPIFWGQQWLTLGHPPVPPAEVIWAIRTIMFSPYMDGLFQYGGVQRGSVESLGLATFDTGPPNGFSHADIESMLKGLLDDRIIPDPGTNDQILAVVFTPPGIWSDDPSANGFHTSMVYQGAQLPYAWIRNDGTVEFISSVYSHELAEACTDPTNQGFIDDSGACQQSGACEIGDYCYGFGPGRGTETHGGVWVQAYWSVADNRCFVPQERFVEGATAGSPSLIQGRFLSPGNFELVAPLQSGGIAHYSRVNSDPALPWAGPAVFAIDLGNVDAVSMIQSTFTAGAGVGNLEVVALSQGSLFAYWREDVPPFRWHGPTVIPLGRVNVRGNPALIQGRFLSPGNFELVVPLASAGMAHFSRVNVDPLTPWYGPNLFGAELGRVDAVTLIQSNYTVGANIGNLEVVARCGGTLFHYWREDVPPYRWFGPNVIPASGKTPGFPLAAGTPSLQQVRQPSFSRNFELVTPLADGGFAHYSRANSLPGLPWFGPAVVGQSLGQIDAVSLIQSTFSLEPSGIGNLELVAQARGQLFHFWLDNPINPVTEGFPWDWFGPWVVTN